MGQVRGKERIARGAERKEKKEKIEYSAAWKVNRSDTLLEFLLAKGKTSRNNVKMLLSKGLVLVNGSVAKRFDFPLAKDDEVKIAKTPVKGAPSARNANQKAAQKRSPFSLKILYEDEEFIAVEKPAGLLAVENEKERECAFAEVLAYLQSKDKNARPFVLHRIDKETSGVLLFAKDVKIHSMLKMRWNELVKVREYCAVAEGTFAKKEDTIISFLKENANNLVYSSHDGSGQRAVTRYKVVKENEKFSLLRVEIDTGRKNQIRVHLHEKKHPIVGDEKYGFTQNPLGRLGLHATKLQLVHPVSGKELTFVSPVPPAFYGLFGK
ncbi:MAG: RluA family pseudouridine synthase [Clostridia bacterium]|nr:RluA family pseudouridine synthase [Clostridia bacterium]